MQVYKRQLNLYFALAAALTLLCGCQTDSKKKQTSALRLYIEAEAPAGDSTESVTVLRDEPVVVTISRTPVLAENSIAVAQVVATRGGFAVQVQFDENGTWMLEQYSAANPGKHFVIFGQWGEKRADARWLAAPLITHRIGNGILSFTPDCSREEADRLVLGLNDVAKQSAKGK